MKLIKDTDYYTRRTDRAVSIAAAIGQVIEDLMGPDGDAVERANSRSEIVAVMFGDLIEMLHADGSLSDENVLALARGFKCADAK